MSHLLQIHDALAEVPIGGVLQGATNQRLTAPLTKLVGKRSADKLLYRAGTPGIRRMTACELVSVAEIDPRRARAVAAARDLHFALSEEDLPRVDGAEHLVSALPPGLRFLEFEVLIGCAFSGALKLLGLVLLAKGGALSANATPRDVFRPMIRTGAVSFALVHNHPSGNPTPSTSDLELTRAVHHLGGLLGLELIDHVIVASGGTTSLRELGHLPQ